MKNHYREETFEQVCQRLVKQEFGEWYPLNWFTQFTSTQQALKKVKKLIEKDNKGE